jgi:hypothetical protein
MKTPPGATTGTAPAYQSPLIEDPCLSQGGLDQNLYGARL